jgi:hypothetical protein
MFLRNRPTLDEIGHCIWHDFHGEIESDVQQESGCELRLEKRQCVALAIGNRRSHDRHTQENHQTGSRRPDYKGQVGQDVAGTNGPRCQYGAMDKPSLIGYYLQYHQIISRSTERGVKGYRQISEN